jgi:hypothetical protein
MTKKTMTAMSDLDFAIQHTELDGKRPNEFTVFEYVHRMREEFPSFTRNQARTRLDKMVDQGWLTCRMIPVNGSISRVFSAAKKS